MNRRPTIAVAAAALIGAVIGGSGAWYARQVMTDPYINPSRVEWFVIDRNGDTGERIARRW